MACGRLKWNFFLCWAVPGLLQQLPRGHCCLVPRDCDVDVVWVYSGLARPHKASRRAPSSAAGFQTGMKIAAKELNISAADSIRALYGDGGLHACTCQMCVSPNSACTAITACKTQEGGLFSNA